MALGDHSADGPPAPPGVVLLVLGAEQMDVVVPRNGGRPYTRVGQLGADPAAARRRDHVQARQPGAERFPSFYGVGPEQ